MIQKGNICLKRGCTPQFDRMRGHTSGLTGGRGRRPGHWPFCRAGNITEWKLCHETWKSKKKFLIGFQEKNADHCFFPHFISRKNTKYLLCMFEHGVYSGWVIWRANRCVNKLPVLRFVLHRSFTSTRPRYERSVSDNKRDIALGAVKRKKLDRTTKRKN